MESSPDPSNESSVGTIESFDNVNALPEVSSPSLMEGIFDSDSPPKNSDDDRASSDDHHEGEKSQPRTQRSVVSRSIQELGQIGANMSTGSDTERQEAERNYQHQQQSLTHLRQQVQQEPSTTTSSSRMNTYQRINPLRDGRIASASINSQLFRAPDGTNPYLVGSPALAERPTGTLFASNEPPHQSVNTRSPFVFDSFGGRQFACQARGITTEHNASNATIYVPAFAAHGAPLQCSNYACRSSGRRFRWCAICQMPVARGNFARRHSHRDVIPDQPRRRNQSPQQDNTKTGDETTSTGASRSSGELDS